MRVLVVEDQPKMQLLLCEALEEAGFAVDGTGDGVVALEQLRTTAYDAVVLDVMLPGIDGFEIVDRLRADDVWTPVLMVTARDAVHDRVHGLDAGADDYLVKPFAFSELISRVRALTRRRSAAQPAAVLRCGPLELDPVTRAVTVSGNPVELSPREYGLLWQLLQRRGDVVGRAELQVAVWGASYKGNSNVVDVYVRYLRDKIDRRFGVDLIRTVRGAGYQLGDRP